MTKTKPPLTEHTKRSFILQYVLNRALAHTGGLDGIEAAKEAERAWTYVDIYHGVV